MAPAASRALLILLAAAALNPTARAIEFDGASAEAPSLAPAAADEPPRETRETLSPCACAAKPRCWRIVMIGDAKLVELHKEEVEKALPNRFFPDTLTFALRRPASDGHFLAVKCGPSRRVCTDKRDVLEERLIKSSLLESLPLNLPEGTLYDPATLKITESGDKIFKQTKQCRKTLIAELAAVVLNPSGE